MNVILEVWIKHTVAHYSVSQVEPVKRHSHNSDKPMWLLQIFSVQNGVETKNYT